MATEMAIPSNQEVFDKVAKHLLTQNEKSLNQLGVYNGCCYRGSDGLTCAAGFLIPDEIYKPAIEGHKWIAVCRVFPEYTQLGDPILIGSLQAIHDAEKVSDWEEALRYLAEKFKLDFNLPLYKQPTGENHGEN